MAQGSFVARFTGAIKRKSKKSDPDSAAAMVAEAGTEQIAVLTRSLSDEKHRNYQLVLLAELGRQLQTVLDPPVAAQIVVNTLERGIRSSFVCLFTMDPERNEFVAAASAGPQAHLIPPGFRQDVQRGLKGRSARRRKTQIFNDLRLEPDFLAFESEMSLSALAVPLMHDGVLDGMLQISAEQPDAFQSADVTMAEAAAGELTRAWERARYQARLGELIEAGISLSTGIEPQAVVREIARIARQALSARFTYVILLDPKGSLGQRGSSGHAPALLKSLEAAAPQKSLPQAALSASRPFRVRDIRRYPAAGGIQIDSGALRSVLAVPIRLHRLPIGAILAFGKEHEVFFNEHDESLGTLLASQSAAAMEGTWLYQELQQTLTTTTQLYQVSFQLFQIEDLRTAMTRILETAVKVAPALRAGVVLFGPDQQMVAQVAVEAGGISETTAHPMQLIEQAMASGTSIYLSDQSTTQICFPVQTNLRRYGGLWLNIPEAVHYDSRHTAALQTLVNQLERAILLNESRQQARQIEAAYQELETTYDRTLAALMSALDARDSETEGHSVRVSRIATYLGEKMGLDGTQLKALQRGSLLHDIGKIGVSDTILHKPGPLDQDEWQLMRLHPDIGKQIVADIPFLQDTLPVIRYHQERWDGSGYPAGLRAEEIPLVARIFSVADAFDALTTDRPYRKRVSLEEAVQYLTEQSGTLFDPEVVHAFERIVVEGRPGDFPQLG